MEHSPKLSWRIECAVVAVIDELIALALSEQLFFGCKDSSLT